MPDWFNDLADIPVIILIMTTLLGALTWVIKREVGAVKHEMFPNSGASLRDAVDRIEQKVDAADEKIAAHVEWHLTHREKWVK